MADKTIPVGGDTGLKLLYKDLGSGVYAPAVSDLSGGGGGSTTFQGLTDRLPFVISNAAQSAIQFKAAGSQTADLVDFIDPAGTTRAWVGSLTQVGDSTLGLRAITSQTGPVLDIRDVSGVTVLQVEPSGRLSTPPTTDLSIRAGTGGNVFIGSGSVDVIDVQGSQILLLQAVRASAANAIGLVVRGATSQTSALQTWNDGTGNTVLARVNAVGGLQLEGSDTNSKLLVAPSGTATLAANDAYIKCNADACVGLIVQGFSGTQTGALTQWRDNGATPRVTIGSLVATADTTLTLRAIGSQGGNLLLLQDSGGVRIANITAAGSFITGSVIQCGATSTLSGSWTLAVQPTATNVSGQFIRAISGSQTATLFEAQDSGAVARVLIGSLTATGDDTLKLRAITSQSGNLLRCRNATDAADVAAISAAGSITGASVGTNTLGIFIRDENSGGKIRFTKASAQATAPGSDKVELYLRDGTLSGTLALSVRGGAAGVETVLFDDLLQATSAGVILGPLKLVDATTNVIVNSLVVGHNTSGTPAAGFGNQMQFQLQSSTTVDRVVGEQSYEWVVATDASRTARFKLTVYDTAVRECLRGEASGSAPMIGFLGAAAVVRQTLAAAASDAGTTQTLANSLRTALINLGLGV